MLYNGEQIGDGSPPQVDIAVDPLEGTTLCAKGMPNALSVIALAERGSMFDPGPCVYMEKIAGGRRHRRPARPRPAAQGDARARRRAARRRDRRRDGRRPRPPPPRARHRRDPRVRRARAAHLRRRRLRRAARGVRPLARRPAVRDRRHARRASSPPRRSSAPAGELVGRLWPRDDEERKAALDAGYDLDLQLTTNDLVRSDHCFFSATGVTDGDVLQGVRYQGSQGRLDGVARHAVALRHRAPRPRVARPLEAARGHRRALRLTNRLGSGPPRARGSGRSSTDRAGKRRTRDSARSRRASDRRKPWVTITWMRDCVALVEPERDPATRARGRSSRPRRGRGAASGRSSTRSQRAHLDLEVPVALAPSCATSSALADAPADDADARRPSRTRARGSSAA